MSTTYYPAEIVKPFEDAVNRAVAGKADIIAGMQENLAKDPLYVLDWADAPARQLAEIWWWEAIQARYAKDDGDPFETLEAYIAEATKALINNWYRPTSSSAYSNATNIARADGASRFVDMAAGLLRFLRARLIDLTEQTATG